MGEQKHMGCGKRKWNSLSRNTTCSLHSKRIKKKAERSQMLGIFQEIWKERPHKSEVSGIRIYGEILTVYFHHILEKEKYPQAKIDKENIILLTWEEHDQVGIDMYRYEEINKRREYLRQKYEV